MKPLILAALIAAPAFGQTITHISERDGYSIKLGDAPCPGNPQMLEARFDSTMADQSTAAGCWTVDGESVRLKWRGDVSVALPVVLPASDFVRAKP
jgi:hypothetical protein